MSKGYYEWACGCVYYFEEIQARETLWKLVSICEKDKRYHSTHSIIEGTTNRNIEFYLDCCRPITKAEAAIIKMGGE